MHGTARKRYTHEGMNTFSMATRSQGHKSSFVCLHNVLLTFEYKQNPPNNP